MLARTFSQRQCIFSAYFVASLPVNLVAMGQARFLLCMGFINRAAMSRARFLLCTGFISSSIFLSVTRPKPPIGQIVIRSLNYATCDVYSPKAVKTVMYGNIMDIAYFIVYKIFFLLV